MSIGVRRNSKRFRDRSRGSDDRVRRCVAEHLERRTLLAAVVNAPATQRDNTTMCLFMVDSERSRAL